MSLIIKNLNLVLKGKELLKEFSIDFFSNLRIGISGPSGCGKSTLVRSIIEQQFPTGSTFEKFEFSHSGQTAFIPQSSGLIPWYTIERNFFIMSSKSGKKTSELNCIIMNLGLSNVLKKYPSQISGGEYQRVLIGMAIILNPNFIFADEPLTEVDLPSKFKILSHFSHQIDKNNGKLLVVSHDPDTLLYLCDLILLIGLKEHKVVSRIAVNGKHPRNSHFLNSPAAVKARENIIATMFRDEEKK